MLDEGVLELSQVVDRLDVRGDTEYVRVWGLEDGAVGQFFDGFCERNGGAQEGQKHVFFLARNLQTTFCCHAAIYRRRASILDRLLSPGSEADWKAVFTYVISLFLLFFYSSNLVEVVRREERERKSVSI